MKRLYAVICTLLIAVSTTYAAEKSAEKNMFKDLDKDRSGTISQKEASKQKQLSKNWASYDTNQDGQLDESEFSAFEAVLQETSEPDD